MIATGTWWCPRKEGPLIALLAMFCAATSALAQPQRADYQSLIHGGFALHQQANYTAALPLLKRALQLQPHDYYANLLVGIDLLRTGQAKDAVVYLGEASRLKPTEDIPLDYLTEAQAGLGHFAEAARVSGRAVEIAPSSEQAVEGAIGFAVERFRTLSSQLRSTTQGMAAENRLQALAHPISDPERMHLLEVSAGLDPDAPGIWSDLALAAAVRGNEQNARDSLREATAHDRGDLRAHVAAALLAARAGDWGVASQQLNAAAEQSPSALGRTMAEWPPYLKLVRREEVTGAAAVLLVCVETGSGRCAPPFVPQAAPKVARSGLQSAKASAETFFRQQRWERVASLPSPADADGRGWFQRGIALAQMGSWSAAATALEHSLQTGFSSVYARYMLSWTYAQRTGETVRLLQANDGGDSTVHLIRGDVLLHMQGSAGAATAEYAAALASRSDDPTLLERMAEAQLQDGHPEAAIQSAQAALRIDPYRFTAMQTIARIAMDQRRYVGALPYLQRLNERDPADAAVEIELGTALARTGDASGAARFLAPPLQHGYPDSKGSLHALLGAALGKLGQKQQAAEAFATARTLSEEYQKHSHAPSDEPQP